MASSTIVFLFFLTVLVLSAVTASLTRGCVIQESFTLTSRPLGRIQSKSVVPDNNKIKTFRKMRIPPTETAILESTLEIAGVTSPNTMTLEQGALTVQGNQQAESYAKVDNLNSLVSTSVMPHARNVTASVMPEARNVTASVMPEARNVTVSVIPSSTDVAASVIPSSTDVPTNEMPPVSDVVASVMPPVSDVATKEMPPASDVGASVIPPASDVGASVMPNTPAISTSDMMEDGKQKAFQVNDDAIKDLGLTQDEKLDLVSYFVSEVNVNGTQKLMYEYLKEHDTALSLALQDSKLVLFVDITHHDKETKNLDLEYILFSVIKKGFEDALSLVLNSITSTDVAPSIEILPVVQSNVVFSKQTMENDRGYVTLANSTNIYVMDQASNYIDKCYKPNLSNSSDSPCKALFPDSAGPFEHHYSIRWSVEPDDQDNKYLDIICREKGDIANKDEYNTKYTKFSIQNVGVDTTLYPRRERFINAVLGMLGFVFDNKVLDICFADPLSAPAKAMIRHLHILTNQ